jgi:transcription initiation factor IIE alpha subunit
MKVAYTHYGVRVEKEPTDKIYTESAFYYKLKRVLLNSDEDLVKKCPAKDGHLTSAPYYLRDRKGAYCYYDEFHAIRDIARDFMKNGSVELHRVEL